MKRLLLLPIGAIALAATQSPTTASEPEEPASAVDGTAIFNQRCAVCHSLEPGKRSSLGPNLAGIVGKEAASGEFRYTSALKGSGLTWSEEELDRYLAAPLKAVPGTRMVISLKDDAERAAVIDYLASTGEGEEAAPAAEAEAETAAETEAESD